MLTLTRAEWKADRLLYLSHLTVLIISILFNWFLTLLGCSCLGSFHEISTAYCCSQLQYIFLNWNTIKVPSFIWWLEVTVWNKRKIELVIKSTSKYIQNFIMHSIEQTTYQEFCTWKNVLQIVCLALHLHFTFLPAVGKATIWPLESSVVKFSLFVCTGCKNLPVGSHCSHHDWRLCWLPLVHWSLQWKVRSSVTLDVDYVTGLLSTCVHVWFCTCACLSMSSLFSHLSFFTFILYIPWPQWYCDRDGTTFEQDCIWVPSLYSVFQYLFNLKPFEFVW